MTNVKKTFVNVIKTLPLLSVVQLHAWCPRNGLQGNSEYAIQLSFAETVVVIGYQWNLQYSTCNRKVVGLFRCCYFESASCWSACRSELCQRFFKQKTFGKWKKNVKTFLHLRDKQWWTENSTSASSVGGNWRGRTASSRGWRMLLEVAREPAVGLRGGNWGGFAVDQ